jgi:GntR family transcriptional regulator
MIKLTGAMPLYEQIKAYILQGIQDGRYRPGERIPSERELADLWRRSGAARSSAPARSANNSRR